MIRPWVFTAALIAIAFSALSSPAAASASEESKPAPAGDKGVDAPKFIRVVRDAKEKPIALETATARYVSSSKKNPVSVDLIGCIHIGDKKYYEAFNERFKQYDAVLFEMVMPEGESLEGLGDRKSSHPISVVQQSLPKMLDLAFQLKEVDYTPKNFVHADLSPDKMAKAMKARGDTGASVVFKVFFDILKESNRQAADRAKKGGELAELELLAAFFDSNRPLRLKRVMADQMEMMSAGSGLGATLDTILVQDRNAAAMQVLSRQIAGGTKKIAVFYGAAHMPDFDRRLTAELKFKREATTWDRAWDMRGK